MSQFPRVSVNRRTLRNKPRTHHVGAACLSSPNTNSQKCDGRGEKTRGRAPVLIKNGEPNEESSKSRDPRKRHRTASFRTVIRSDLGTGNLVPPVANMGAADAYAQVPAIYGREYVRHRHGYRSVTPRAIDRDNTSVPGQSFYKDDTTPRSR